MPTTSTPSARRTRSTAATSLALAVGAGAFAGVTSTVHAEQAQAVESTYTVQAGDGWWIISQRTGVSMTTLQSLNGMTAATELHPGMVLKTSGTTAASTSTAGTYTVRAGDGWWSISQRTGVSMTTLQSLNGMTSSTVLHPGMVLKTSGSTTTAAPAPVVRQTTTSKAAAVSHIVGKVNNPSTYYQWGGTGAYGYDCSGLTQEALEAAGIAAPRRGHDQYLAAKSYVPVSQAQPGDLVFFADQSTGRVYHVAMYIGGGQLAHALNETRGLAITSTNIMTSDMLSVAGRY